MTVSPPTDSVSTMKSEIARILRGRRTQMRERWEMLLRIERTSTPLANPDVLIHLFDRTLDDVCEKISGPDSVEVAAPSGSLPQCPCGRNPFVAYYKAAKQ